jgi:hypothetical protein
MSFNQSIVNAILAFANADEEIRYCGLLEEILKYLCLLGDELEVATMVNLQKLGYLGTLVNGDHSQYYHWFNFVIIKEKSGEFTTICADDEKVQSFNLHVLNSVEQSTFRTGILEIDFLGCLELFLRAIFRSSNNAIVTRDRSHKFKEPMDMESRLIEELDFAEEIDLISDYKLVGDSSEEENYNQGMFDECCDWGYESIEDFDWGYESIEGPISYLRMLDEDDSSECQEDASEDEEEEDFVFDEIFEISDQFYRKMGMVGC